MKTQGVGDQNAQGAVYLCRPRAVVMMQSARTRCVYMYAGIGSSSARVCQKEGVKGNVETGVRVGRKVFILVLTCG